MNFLIYGRDEKYDVNRCLHPAQQSDNSWIHFFELTSALKRYIVWQDGYFLWMAVKFNLYVWERLGLNLLSIHCKKKVSDCRVPSRMSLTKLSLAFYCCDFKCKLFACFLKLLTELFFYNLFINPKPSNFVHLKHCQNWFE